ncbi:hypothetical protein EUTSA_v10002354mg [Eutrema salsugineum]|uniref:non-specific serine/threonine protein kinase n=1 Tax=Eutrema salsugineum TaxID=72664 RepID=V4MYJ1_EUTSA|nr:hypothetical protein EUTSA_v10002354mg [Eutrema salsugineum]
MKTTSFIFTFAVTVFFTAVPSCFSADQQYEKCRLPLRCSPGPTLLPNISYPFWGVNKPSYCGQREFQLSCNNHQNLTLDLANFSLRVISFDLENQTLTVADESLLEGGCPYLSLNFSGSNQYTLAPTIEKIDLFTCSASPEVESVSSFTCGTSNRNIVTFHAFKSSNTIRACVKSGEVPLLSSVKVDFQQSRLTLEEALKKGFDLRYNIRKSDSCNLCLSSGGICGSESVSRSFHCLCSDRPHNYACLYQALVPLKRYSYSQVKKITKSFTHEVGKGGFGIVYRGFLCDGRKVAVKVLKDTKRNNGDDFINEVASMSKTSHVNIVTLLGFCFEGSKRAIIYEFLENGSLDKFISSNKASGMDWSALYGIALGVARGLEYLHNGCRERIVHFDIKPHNVLLDDNLCPKVSDFGLAKLCENKESILSLLETRGTVGYIAPEVFSRMYGRVSHKSDVYSYGMLVLEMIGARNQAYIEDSASNTSSMYFPEWIYKDLEKGYNKRLIKNGISSEEDETVRKMTLVGLWCIQSSPLIRPPMNRVVEMMEGSVNALEVPPKPVLQQNSAAPFSESSWISEENSSPCEV